MAAITPRTLDADAADDDSRTDYRRVEGAEHTSALSLLLTGGTRGQDGAVDRFVSFAREQSMDIRECWAAVHLGKPVATALIIPSPGKTAMVFVSPVRSHTGATTTTRLLTTATAAQDPAALRLIQALLDPGQRLERGALLDAGYTELAHLIYMERHAEPQRAPLRLDGGIEVHHWSEENRKLFQEAILKSYEQTLDCPGLLGLRHIDDIITGHKATGIFDPALWHALYSGNDPVGVMLLNIVPQRSALELVYIGITPRWRGKGLGRKLVNHALGRAHDRQMSQLLLAVDQTNSPAMALYRSLRFSPQTRKLAMIRVLDK